MKRILSSILLLLAVQGIAQSKKPGQALLWRISGNGLAKPSYLYGTIHMICENDFYLSGSLKAAVEEVDGLVFELNLADSVLNKKIQRLMYSPVSLRKRLSPENYHLLDSLMQVKASVPLQQFEYMNLMAISSFLSSRMMACGQPKSYEASLLALARAKHKTIAGLESPEEQLVFFNKAITDSVLISQMLDTEKSEILLQKMVDLYKQEDIEALNSIVDDQNAKKWMLDVRNANWIKVMPGLMKKESTLFVVGAGHLGAEMGLIKSLSKLGYLLEPVKRD
ncbi:TraB/GumN family protein [Pedobacter sp. MC2016-14]|uniref:TraB/GumN family protein n=1 Tax=Pedobacter sp. MC2016-14 TaxID=2897327 RepID=UPI001E6140EA|nr:TraB/GumN family protein [Pedobacter sp. MC2016-14]MCD0488629.1 TraB/GumN family protein [Pedobacter sp. MC2016-14]